MFPTFLTGLQAVFNLMLTVFGCTDELGPFDAAAFEHCLTLKSGLLLSDGEQRISMVCNIVTRGAPLRCPAVRFKMVPLRQVPWAAGLQLETCSAVLGFGQIPMHNIFKSIRPIG